MLEKEGLDLSSTQYNSEWDRIYEIAVLRHGRVGKADLVSLQDKRPTRGFSRLPHRKEKPKQRARGESPRRPSQ